MTRKKRKNKGGVIPIKKAAENRLSGLFLLKYSSFASFSPHALKGQKLLAQGSALGYYG